MGDKGSVYIKEKDENKHIGFSKELFTRTDGQWKIGKEKMKAMGVEAEVHNVSDII
jgi:ribosomal protein L21